MTLQDKITSRKAELKVLHKNYVDILEQMWNGAGYTKLGYDPPSEDRSKFYFALVELDRVDKTVQEYREELKEKLKDALEMRSNCDKDDWRRFLWQGVAEAYRDVLVLLGDKQ